MPGYDPRVQAWQRLDSYVSAPVTLAEAETQVCPLCGAGRRRRCVYVGKISRGLPMRGQVHGDRKQAVRAARRALWLERHPPQAAPAQLPPSARQAAAAMRAWDMAEYGRLRAWWAANGHIVAGASPCRADGTMPGKRTLQTVRSELL